MGGSIIFWHPRFFIHYRGSDYIPRPETEDAFTDIYQMEEEKQFQDTPEELRDIS